MHLGGESFYVQCAEEGMNHLGECSGIQICVYDGTTQIDAVRTFLPERHITPIQWGTIGVYGGLIKGDCNIISGDSVGITRESASTQSWNGSYVDMDNFEVAKGFYSRYPIAGVLRQDDPEFGDFVNAILFSLMAAEQQNITQNTAHLVPQTMLFGDQFKDMFRHALAYAGNYDMLYHRPRTTEYLRKHLSTLNNGSTGLLYPHPFGQISNGRNDAPLGETMSSILDRGELYCGILMDHPGFATKERDDYAGMDVDFCRALAAALFGGQSDAVVFVEVEEDADGYVLLASNEIDVLAGATWTLEADVREPTTEQGYSFSPPYFYGSSQEKENRCLATRQDGADWSKFVYWLVTSTFYAEEKGINSTSFNAMPEVFVFGPDLRQMFRSSVLEMGSYADMYERNLEAMIPRGGRNVLNGLGSNAGPQQYVIPGFF